MTIFDKIIQKEIPSAIVYEDEDFIAFLDIAQTTKGHTLLVPKHYAHNFLDCNPIQLQAMIVLAQKLANHLVNKLQAKGINILMNCHPAAGQSVDHFHIHLIPRYDESDGIKIHFKENPGQDLQALADILKIKP